MSVLNIHNITRGMVAGGKTTEEIERPRFSGDFYPTSSYFGRHYSEAQRQTLAMNCAFFFADISVLARKAGSADISVVRRVGEQQYEGLPDHPFELLFRRPNHLLSGEMLMQYSMAWLGLDGNAYWLLVPRGAEIVEMWPLPAREVYPVADKKKVIGAYAWRRMGKEDVYSAESICHFRLVNPFSVLSGVGFVNALRWTIEGNEARQKYNRDFFDKKRAIPEAVGVLPKDVSDTDYDRLIEEMEREFGGGKRRVLWVRGSEKINVERLGLTHQEMDFLAGQEFDGKLVDRVCGFPEGYWAMKANRANAEQAERSLARDTVQPMLSMFASAIEAQIIDRYYERPEENLQVQFANIIPQDRALEVAEFSAYSQVMTIDEARGQRGLQPLNDWRGEMLVPELMKMGGMGMGIPSFPSAKSETDGELTQELRTWLKVALREVARGHDPSAREFVSDEIPGYIRDQIEIGLIGKIDEHRVRAVFQPWLDGKAGGWVGYP